MKALLICPAERSAVHALAESGPLANLQALGKPLVAYWLEHLVTLGAKEVRILAADRPEQVRALVGDGSRWGLQIEVSPEIREFTIAEALTRYRKSDSAAWLAEPNDVSLMDHFPARPDLRLFESYGGWFAGVLAILGASHTGRLGMRESSAGVWVGLRARVSPSAVLKAPCWVGSNAIIGPNAVVGPEAVIEDRVMVDVGVEVSHSMVGPETFVGQFTELKDSVAQNNVLVNWRSESSTTVPDAFLMSGLGHRARRRKPGNWLGRLSALTVMGMTMPIAAIPILKAKIRNQPSLRSHIAVRPQLSTTPCPTETMVYYELANCAGWLRFWPQLWNIARGDFAWVGNRPLSPAEVAELTNDFERLWLAAPIGLISLADAEGTTEPFGDDTRACASFYAVMANWRLDLSILARTFMATTKRSLTTIF